MPKKKVIIYIIGMLIILIGLRGSWYMLFHSQQEVGSSMNYLGQKQSINFDGYTAVVKFKNEEFKIPYEHFAVTTNKGKKRLHGVYYVNKTRGMENKFLYKKFANLPRYKVTTDKLLYVTTYDEYKKMKQIVSKVDKSTEGLDYIKDDSELTKTSKGVILNKNIAKEYYEKYIINTRNFTHPVLNSLLTYTPVGVYFLIAMLGWYMLSKNTIISTPEEKRKYREKQQKAREKGKDKGKDKGNKERNRGIEEAERRHKAEEEAKRLQQKREKEAMERLKRMEAEQEERTREIKRKSTNGIVNEKGEPGTNADIMNNSNDKLEDLKRKIAEKKAEMLRKQARMDEEE